MNRAELKRYIKGPIATLPTAMDDAYHIDCGRMAELTQWWIESGYTPDRAPIKVAAAGGEGPDLRDDEWPHLLRTVVNAAAGEAVVLCGLQCKDTRGTIEDAKRAQDLGAIGLQIMPPIFHHPTQDDYVRFFSDISDAIEIGIMIYNTPWFGCESITAETMLRLADAEHVTALKWSVVEGQDYDDMRQFADTFNVIDNSHQPIRGHKNGGAGYIDPLAAIYPAHVLKVWELTENEKYDEAQALYESVNLPLREFMAKLGRRSGGYRLAKGLMDLLGRPVGPPRPPTLPLNEAEMAELRELVQGFGWPLP